MSAAPDQELSDPTSAVVLGASPAITVRSLGVEAGGRTVISHVDLDIQPGTLVAIAGPSGAGKTTLLEAIAGLRPVVAGEVRLAAAGAGVGFVPQDDIIHGELPLGRTLHHAARLRMPGLGRSLRADVVAEVLQQLDLHDHARTRVGALSGGQRKRASLATEVLDEPRLLFLDEPTSGLDPVSSADVTRVLRGLRSRGVTVVMTTHDPLQLHGCDQVVLLARGGRVAYSGMPSGMLGHFGAHEIADVYRQLGAPTADVPLPAGSGPVGSGSPPQQRRPGPFGHQVRVLARRTLELTAANRLTLAVLLGSPVLVIAMMAVLFPAGGFAGDRTTAAQTAFWMAFSAFFFGLTYGLLQVVSERPVADRERVAGVRPTAYVASKVVVLLPLLAAIDVALVLVLRALDRLPVLSAGDAGALGLTLVLASLAALTLGLAASALVSDAAQATLALPMLCFPQVLFAGAVVPRGDMAATGEAISSVLVTRWTFESLGRGLAISHPGYADAFTGAPAAGWAVLLVIAASGAAVAVAAARRTRGVRR